MLSFTTDGPDQAVQLCTLNIFTGLKYHTQNINLIYTCSKRN